MRIIHDDEALLEQLGALAREEAANARAAQAQLGPLDACAERAFNAVRANRGMTRPVPVARSKSWAQRLRRALRAWYCIPLLLPVGGTMLFLFSSLAGTEHTTPPVEYELSVLSGGAGLRGTPVALPASPRVAVEAPSRMARRGESVEAQPRNELRAGSTVRLLLRPREQTLVAPHAAVSFDNGVTVQRVTAEETLDTSGAVQLLLTLPAQPGRLKIDLAEGRVWTIPIAASPHAGATAEAE